MNGSEIVAFLIILCINVFFSASIKKNALKKSVYLDFSLMCLSPLNE